MSEPKTYWERVATYCAEGEFGLEYLQGWFRKVPAPPAPGWISVKDKEPVFPCFMISQELNAQYYPAHPFPGVNFAADMLWVPAPPPPPDPDEQAFEDWINNKDNLFPNSKAAFLAGIKAERERNK